MELQVFLMLLTALTADSPSYSYLSNKLLLVSHVATAD